MLGVQEFETGWRPLVGAIFGVGSGLTGIVFYTHGVFVIPITDEFGWSRGETQFAFSFVMISAVITGPFIGILSDRFGARLIALLGLFALSLTFASLSLTNATLSNYYLLWIVMSVLSAGTFPVTWTRGVNTWFDSNRGLALGLTMVGTGIVAAIGPILAVKLISNYGWRDAYFFLGLIILLISLPIVFLFFHEKEKNINNSEVDTNLDGMNTKLALLNYKFWLLGFSMLFIAYGVAGIITNFVPLLIDKGYKASEAASYAGFIGAMVIVGRLLVGYLVDRVWAPLIAFVFFLLPCIACWVLIQDLPSPFLVTVGALSVGLAAGAELDFIAYMTSRYFGMKNYGRLYSIQFIFFAIGSGTAPATFGLSFDLYGSYDLILTLSSIFFIFSAMLVILMGQYPKRF